MPAPIVELYQLNQTSPFIELFTVDLTSIGGAVYNFTNTPSATGGALTFGGVSYTPAPVVANGFDFTSTGSAARPTLSIPNVFYVLLPDVISKNDIVGATVKRIRTYEKFLDGKPDADSSQRLGPDVFLIESKLSHDNEWITFQLSGLLDRFGMKLPRRQVLKDKGFPGVSRTRIR